mgnify:CR=1 FL=1
MPAARAAIIVAATVVDPVRLRAMHSARSARDSLAPPVASVNIPDRIDRRASRQEKGATVFGYWVKDPERFGVIDFDENGKALSLKEIKNIIKNSFSCGCSLP